MVAMVIMPRPLTFVRLYRALELNISPTWPKAHSNEGFKNYLPNYDYFPLFKNIINIYELINLAICRLPSKFIIVMN